MSVAAMLVQRTSSPTTTLNKTNAKENHLKVGDHYCRVKPEGELLTY